MLDVILTFRKVGAFVALAGDFAEGLLVVADFVGVTLSVAPSLGLSVDIWDLSLIGANEQDKRGGGDCRHLWAFNQRFADYG